MKARVKATGEIVEVTPESYYTRKEGMYLKFTDEEGISYLEDELDFYVESKDPDYWEKLKHQYAGMAMQAYINNNVYMREIRTECKTPKEMRELIADLSILLATALVEKLKSESNGK